MNINKECMKKMRRIKARAASEKKQEITEREV